MVEKQVAVATYDGIRELTDKEFREFQTFIYREAGISLSDAKRTLVYSRLAKRLRVLGLQTYTEYLKFLADADRDGSERQEVINRLTTNKTDFFREPHHFDFLRDVVFPAARERARQGHPRELTIWSSACSTGEEPYSIAMSILEHFGDSRGWKIRILATDINTEVLATASQGLYALDKMHDVDAGMLRRFFLRGTGSQSGYCRVRPEVQSLIEFRQLNLLEGPLPVRTKFDAIFCRNVIIYFDLPTQQKLLPQFASRIKDGGYLMLGHSENVPWLSKVFEPLGHTVHRLRPSDGSIALPMPTTPSLPQRSAPRAAPAPAKPAVATSTASRKPSQQESELPKERRNIIAGETFATDKPVVATTVLGSCVAACLYDPVAKVGGMNHFMLPFQQDDRTASARYGIHAMELLINEIMHLGGDRRRLRAKVFGGARVLASDVGTGIGLSNVSFIREFLEVERIPIVSEKLGGDQALRVNFVPTTGQAFVKTIVSNRTLLDSERRDSERAWNSYATKSENDTILF